MWLSFQLTPCSALWYYLFYKGEYKECDIFTRIVISSFLQRWLQGGTQESETSKGCWGQKRLLRLAAGPHLMIVSIQIFIALFYSYIWGIQVYSARNECLQNDFYLRWTRLLLWRRSRKLTERRRWESLSNVYQKSSCWVVVDLNSMHDPSFNVYPMFIRRVH